MDCTLCNEAIIRDLKRAIKGNNLKRDIIKIIKKYDNNGSDGNVHADYTLNSGESYYIQEAQARIIYTVFQQVLKRRYRGLCITRTNPDNMAFSSVLENTEFYWLTTMKKENSVSPGDLHKLLAIIKDFLKKDGRGAIVIDGVNSLIVNNGFNSFLKFIQTAKDAVSEKHGILLISININSLDDRERAMLQNELKEISIKR